MYDIVIIGAGVIGTIIARELSRYKLNIAILEKENDVSCGASKANSGIIHGGYDAKHGTIKAIMSRRGNQMYDKLNSELNFGLDRIGSLVLGYNKDDLLKLEKLMKNGIKNGVSDLKIIYADEIKNLEPNINESVYCALYCPSAGIVSPYEVTIALAENAVLNGVKLFLNEEVKKINLIKDNKKHDFFSIKSSNKKFESKYIINCAGVYSDKIANMIGLNDFYIIPRKGEYMVFEKYYGDIAKHVLFQVPSEKGKGVLVTKTYHNNLMIGPNAQEAGGKDDTGTSIDVLKSIFLKSKNSIKSIDGNKIIRSFAGLRASSSRHDFIIEESKIKNFINVAGIESPGLTSAPAIADYVVNEILAKKESLEEKENFKPNRKAIISRKNKNDLLNPLDLKPLLESEEYICRCEQVKKSTIIDSLSRGINIISIDAVKRRTRAGMGVCQGVFCGKRVKKVIAEYYNINEEEVKNRDTSSGLINERADKKSIIKYLKD